jgi:hypothetical protein
MLSVPGLFPVLVPRVAVIAVIPVVAAIPDYRLVIPVLVACVCAYMVPVVTVGIGLIDHNLISMVQVYRPVTGREAAGIYPARAIRIDKHCPVDVVIAVDVGEVIKTGIVVTGRTPGGLVAYINVDAYLCICIFYTQYCSQ